MGVPGLTRIIQSEQDMGKERENNIGLDQALVISDMFMNFQCSTLPFYGLCMPRWIMLMTEHQIFMNVMVGGGDEGEPGEGALDGADDRQDAEGAQEVSVK